jgi:hypothetical protein
VCALYPSLRAPTLIVYYAYTRVCALILFFHFFIFSIMCARLFLVNKRAYARAGICLRVRWIEIIIAFMYVQAHVCAHACVCILCTYSFFLRLFSIFLTSKYLFFSLFQNMSLLLCVLIPSARALTCCVYACTRVYALVNKYFLPLFFPLFFSFFFSNH